MRRLTLILALVVGCAGEDSLPRTSDAGVDAEENGGTIPPVTATEPGASDVGTSNTPSKDASSVDGMRASVGADAGVAPDVAILVSEAGRPLQPSPTFDAPPARAEDSGVPDARMIMSVDGVGPPPATIRTDAAPVRPLVFVTNADTAECTSQTTWVFPLELNSIYCGTIAQACRAVCKSAECRVANYIQGLQETYCLDRLPEP